MRTQLSQVSEHSGPPRDLKKTLKRRLIGREGRRQGKPEGILKPMPASRPPQGDFSGGPPSFRQFFLSILGALPCQAPIPVLYGKQSSERETVTRNITFLGLTLLLLTPLALSAGDEEGLPEGQARTGVATVTHVKDRVDVKQIVETINTKTSFKARAPEEKIFSFTDGPMEFFDPPALITPVRAPEEEKFSFADWLNPTSES